MNLHIGMVLGFLVCLQTVEVHSSFCSSNTNLKSHIAANHIARKPERIPADPTQALDFAIYKNNFPLVQAMIAKGANVNARDAAGRTLLTGSVMLNRVVITEYLVTHGANVHAQEHKQRVNWRYADLLGNNETALHWAAYNGNTEITEFLLAHGACVDAFDSGNETPFSQAIAEKHFAVATILIQHRANVNVRTSPADVTPLSSAIIENDVDAVNFLLTHGANVNASGAARMYPIMFAAATNEPSVMITQLLIEKGAVVNVQNTDGVTALMIAAREGNRAEVKLLLAHNASTSIVDNDGNKASDYATVSKHLDLLPLLTTEKPENESP